MKLEHFELQGFAQHQNISFAFRDGSPDLIIGPNEAGKSNLMTGLLGTLFGITEPLPYIPWHGEPVMTGRLRFRTGDDLVEIERRFIDQQVDVTINGEQIYAGRGLVERSTAEDRRYQALLNEWIGFGEPEVFKRTVFVGQDLLLDDKLSSFAAQIKQIITGSQETSYDEVIKELEDRLSGTDGLKMTGRARTPRRLERLQATLKGIEERHREAEDVQREVAALNQEMNELEAQLVEAKETRARYQSLIDNYGRYQEYSRKEKEARRAWRERSEQKNRLETTLNRRQELETEAEELHIPGDPDPEQIRSLGYQIEQMRQHRDGLAEAVEAGEAAKAERQKLDQRLLELQISGEPDPVAIERLDWEIGRLQQDITNMQAQIKREQRPTPPTSPQAANGMSGKSRLLLAIAGLAIAAGAIGAGIVINPILFAGVLLAAIPFLIIIIDLARSNDTDTVEPTPARQGQRSHDLQGELQRIEGELAEQIRQRDEYLHETGLATLEQVAERAREYQRTRIALESAPGSPNSPLGQLQQVEEALAGLIDKRDGLLEASGEESLEDVYNRATTYRDRCNRLDELERPDPEELDALGEYIDQAMQDAAIAERQKADLEKQHPEILDIPAERIAEYHEELQGAADDEQRITNRLNEIRMQRRYLGRGVDDAAALEEQLAELRDEIAHVELLADAHELAIETLEESVREFQENALDPVGEDASRSFARITGGRYHRVSLDRQTMSPSVAVDARTSIPFERLSRGAKDQLYLSIRTALIEALSGGRHLPLVLDDPAVNFDDERLATAAGLIAELARERQILLFTKDETWTQWFEPSLRLARPAPSPATSDR